MKYLSDYESANDKCIPFVKSISRIGWIDREFFPYNVSDQIVFETEYKEASWGNPTKLMGSFYATSVGLERMAGILKYLPFAIYELQVLNNKRLLMMYLK